MGRRKKGEAPPVEDECVQLTLRIPVRLHRWVKIHAALTRQSMNEIAIEALLDYHDKVEPEATTT